MRLSVVLIVVALAGVVGGAALIGLPAVGGAIIFDSLAVGGWALLRDDGAQTAAAVSSSYEVPTLAQVLERARVSS